MAVIIELVEPVAWDAVALGLHGFWQGLVLTELMTFLLHLRRPFNASTRYAVWAVTLLAVLCLPLLGGGDGGEAVEMGRRLESAVYIPSDRFVRPAFEERRGLGMELLSNYRQRAEQNSMWGTEMQLPSGSWPLFVLGLWGAVSAVLVARLGAGLLYMRQLKQMGAPLPAKCQRRLRHWLEVCGLKRQVQLRSCGAISTPVAVGLLHPVILIPKAMAEQLNERELDQVYLHELAHMRRWDDWTNLAQRVIAALCWFFPSIWWIGRRLDLEREIACDDWVVALSGESRSYAACLTRLIELSSWTRLPALAAGAVMRRSHISTRIALLLGAAAQPGTWSFLEGSTGHARDPVHGYGIVERLRQSFCFPPAQTRIGI